jgi:hypothetical protein
MTVSDGLGGKKQKTTNFKVLCVIVYFGYFIISFQLCDMFTALLDDKHTMNNSHIRKH